MPKCPLQTCSTSTNQRELNLKRNIKLYLKLSKYQNVKVSTSTNQARKLIFVEILLLSLRFFLSFSLTTHDGIVYS